MCWRHPRGQFLLSFVIIAAAAALASRTVLPADSAGEARLVAYETFPGMDAESCEWEIALPQPPSYASAGASAVQLPDGSSRRDVAARQPLTFIQDPWAAFSSIAVDPARNEVVVTDENKFR